MIAVATPTELSAQLDGVIAFPVTPFDERGDVDFEAFRENLAYMVGGGITAMVIAGGTGELYSLTPDECKDLYRSAVEEVGQSCTLIAGVGFGARLATALARDAETSGLAGVMVFPPYYVTSDQEGLFSYYEAVATSTDLGVFPYARDHANLSIPLIKRLAKLPNVVAYKDGRGDLRSWNEIRAAVSDQIVCLSGAGDDLAIPFLAAGAVGFTSSVANYDVDTPLAIFEACRQGNEQVAYGLLEDRQVLPVYALRQRRRGHEVTVTKRAMDILGRRGGSVRPPLCPLDVEEDRELQGLLGRLKAGQESPVPNEAGGA